MTHVFDPQCGFLAITAPTLRRLKLGGLARDYFFENDMLIRLNVLDARVVDVDTSSLYADETSYLGIRRPAGASRRGCCADSCGASRGAT